MSNTEEQQLSILVCSFLLDCGGSSIVTSVILFLFGVYLSGDYCSLLVTVPNECRSMASSNSNLSFLMPMIWLALLLNYEVTKEDLSAGPIYKSFESITIIFLNLC